MRFSSSRTESNMSIKWMHRPAGCFLSIRRPMTVGMTTAIRTPLTTMTIRRMMTDPLRGIPEQISRLRTPQMNVPADIRKRPQAAASSLRAFCQAVERAHGQARTAMPLFFGSADPPGKPGHVLTGEQGKVKGRERPAAAQRLSGRRRRLCKARHR